MISRQSSKWWNSCWHKKRHRDIKWSIPKERFLDPLLATAKPNPMGPVCIFCPVFFVACSQNPHPTQQKSTGNKKPTCWLQPPWGIHGTIVYLPLHDSMNAYFVINVSRSIHLFTPYNPCWEWYFSLTITKSKKSPTGPTTSKPEDLIALVTYLGVRWQGPI